jgi:hypothetical protein
MQRSLTAFAHILFAALSRAALSRYAHRAVSNRACPDARWCPGPCGSGDCARPGDGLDVARCQCRRQASLAPGSFGPLVHLLTRRSPAGSESPPSSGQVPESWKSRCPVETSDGDEVASRKPPRPFVALPDWRRTAARFESVAAQSTPRGQLPKCSLSATMSAYESGRSTSTASGSTA